MVSGEIDRFYAYEEFIGLELLWVLHRLLVNIGFILSYFLLRSTHSLICCICYNLVTTITNALFFISNRPTQEALLSNSRYSSAPLEGFRNIPNVVIT